MKYSITLSKEKNRNHWDTISSDFGLWSKFRDDFEGTEGDFNRMSLKQRNFLLSDWMADAYYEAMTDRHCSHPDDDTTLEKETLVGFYKMTKNILFITNRGNAVEGEIMKELKDFDPDSVDQAIAMVYRGKDAMSRVPVSGLLYYNEADQICHWYCGLLGLLDAC